MPNYAMKGVTLNEVFRQVVKTSSFYLLAVVRCLEAWRHFLEGTVVKFEI